MSTLSQCVVSANKSGGDILGSSLTIMPQLPRGALHGLLKGSDGKNPGYEYLHDVLSDLVLHSVEGVDDNHEGIVLTHGYANYKHEGLSRMDGDDDLFAQTLLQVYPGLISVENI